MDHIVITNIISSIAIIITVFVLLSRASRSIQDTINDKITDLATRVLEVDRRGIQNENNIKWIMDKLDSK